MSRGSKSRNKVTVGEPAVGSVIVEMLLLAWIIESECVREVKVYAAWSLTLDKVWNGHGPSCAHVLVLLLIVLGSFPNRESRLSRPLLVVLLDCGYLSSY